MASWIWPRNRFEQRLAGNLRPGLALALHLDAVARVLGGAALEVPGEVVTADLFMDRQGVRIEVVSRAREMLPIYADDAGNLEEVLRWYRRHGVRRLRVSVLAPNYFWLPSTGTHELG